MLVGVVMYPGSNGHRDMMEYFRRAGDRVVTIWHEPKSASQPRCDLLVLPGGFAYGDREYTSATGEYSMAPGKKASNDGVVGYIRDSIKHGTTVLGVCNGFQTLIHMGLLPGELVQNAAGKFECARVSCFGEATGGSCETLEVANEYGRYVRPRMADGSVDASGRVILRYADTEYSVRNGSEGHIAGVASDDGRIFGMMPHPERTHNALIIHWIRDIAARRYRCTEPISTRIERLMSSEHVAYGRTKECLKQLPTAGEHVLVGPGENAGIVDIGNGWAAAIRIESHNHPTYIDPYNGAATGVGGMVRDILAVGARPIALLDFLRFGTDKRASTLLPFAVKGIADYGNCLGVPNVGGDLMRGSCYDKNPLMNAACLGLVRKDNIVLGHVVPRGTLLCVGGKTGKEGVGGACMASGSLPTDEAELDKLGSAVQTGDPFLERLLLEACTELAEAKVLSGMQDLGAGGLTCAVVEMVQRGRKRSGKSLGCMVVPGELPTKGGKHLELGDAMISESQERMLLCIERSAREKVKEILDKWDLESTEVGEVNDGGVLQILHQLHSCIDTVCAWKFNDDHELGKLIVDYSADDLDPAPHPATPAPAPLADPPTTLAHDATPVLEYSGWSQYDSTIGARTRIHSPPSSSLALLEVPEAECMLALTWGADLDTCFVALDPLRLRLKQPGNALGVVNGLNFGDPVHVMPEFEAAVGKLAEDCKRWGVPVLGGNVSMHNTTAGQSIPGTVMLVLLTRFDLPDTPAAPAAPTPTQ